MIWQKYEDIGLQLHQSRTPVNIYGVVIAGLHGFQLTFGDVPCAIQETSHISHSAMLKRS